VTNLPSLGSRGEGWVALQIVFLLLVAFSGVVAGGAWSGGIASIASLGGLALMMGGALLLGRGLMDLGGNLTPLPYPRDDARLVESGIYGVVRHPIYGGLVVTAFGWALVSVSLVTLVLAFGLAVFFDLKSRREEVWLRERYAGYRDYMARTKRLVPKIY
jgi:protein-S-isoprenylcysteine O-methyltransferase Ste14